MGVGDGVGEATERGVGIGVATGVVVTAAGFMTTTSWPGRGMAVGLPDGDGVTTGDNCVEMAAALTEPAATGCRRALDQPTNAAHDPATSAIASPTT